VRAPIAQTLDNVASLMAAFEDATAGAAAAAVSVVATYPLDVAKTRLQAQRRTRERDGSPRRSNGEKLASPRSQEMASEITRLASGPLPYVDAIDCLRRIPREEGLPALFAGLRLAVLKAALTNFIYFYNLRALSRLLGKAPMLQGMAAGLAVQLVVLPIDLLVTRLQSKYHSSAPGGFFAVISQIVEREGFFGLWAGLGPGLLLTVNPGLTQLVLARLGGTSSRTGLRISAARAFWSGAAAKAIASTATYPSTRAKVQMQVQGMSSVSGEEKLGMVRVLQTIVAESGLLAVFDGLLPQLTNAVLKEAILNLVRVKVALLVRRLFRLLQLRVSAP